MPDDILSFLAGVSLLGLYLWCSAATEMGTRWPQRSDLWLCRYGLPEAMAMSDSLKTISIGERIDPP